MRLIRAVAVVLLVLGAGMAGAVVGTAPAHAGGWATTVLDPVPGRFEPGKSYTIGFWVLQHGSHPYDDILDPVGLQLTGPNGTTIFRAVPLPEPAHFVTSIYLPTAGSYALVGKQGLFPPYRVGTIAVPGGLTALPVPPPAQVPDSERPWKEIRPPDMPVDPDRQPFDDTAALPVPPATTTPAAAAGTTTATRTASQNMRPTTTVLAALAATAVILGLLLVHRRRP